MRILVVGCPRSGTGYASQVLAAHGFDVRHEAMGADGISDWRRAGEKDWDVVLHQTRHPLDCIASLRTINDRSLKWAANRVEFTSNDWFRRHPRPVAGLAEFWLLWNQKCEDTGKWAYRRYRVEDMRREWPVTAALLGSTRKWAYHDDGPTTFNSRKDQPTYRKVTWAQIDALGVLGEDVREMAREYGSDDDDID